ncbi:DUF6252 family protein [Croceimicrobium hydrocarbonivorans]|uniref:Lipoprotein n=1 Tax=Croceimicrobium hydrocarbonivorans TaxID=2761580 RepID=A0A7H0VJ33_9FLAO|nr:DUF6252 family protein [Croceimicrobium hydrocarbonivorans]QNR25731.1 hypothetical protein H4K34_07785 [Croceimicrobium hydrocarbonivorans]
MISFSFKPNLHKLCLVVLIMVSTACDEEPKPEGPNLSFSEVICYVNGELWRDCRKGIAGPYANNYGQYFVGNYLDIDALDFCKLYTDLSTGLYLKLNVTDTGYYPIREHHGSFIIYNLDPEIDTKIYETDSLSEGYVHISRFYSNNQRSYIDGEFAFTAYLKDSNEVVQVSDGTIKNVELSHY